MRRDRFGSDIGTVSIKPEGHRFVVGRRYVFEITYTAGPKGVEAGGALRFKLPGLILGPDKRGPISCSNPNVKWTCLNHLPKTDAANGAERVRIDYTFVVIREDVLMREIPSRSAMATDSGREWLLPKWPRDGQWKLLSMSMEHGLRPAAGSILSVIPRC